MFNTKHHFLIKPIYLYSRYLPVEVGFNITVSAHSQEKASTWKEFISSGTTKYYLPVEKFTCVSNFSVHRFKDHYEKYPQLISHVVLYGFKKVQGMFHFLKECDFERKIITECFFLFAASRARPSCSEQYPTFPNTRSFRLNATDGIDHLKIECDDGFIQKEPTEQAVMTCKNGIWHGSMIPSCESNFKIKDFFPQTPTA